MAHARRRYIDTEKFRMERLKARMTRRDAARVLGVTLKTIRNWEAGRSRVPYSAFKLLRILGGYALPGQAWRGFYLRGDTIWSPEGRSFQAADLAWWGLTVAMARSFRERSRSVQPSPLPQPQSALEGDCALARTALQSATAPRKAARTPCLPPLAGAESEDQRHSGVNFVS